MQLWAKHKKFTKKRFARAVLLGTIAFLGGVAGAGISMPKQMWKVQKVLKIAGKSAAKWLRANGKYAVARAIL
jgi:hypothetical protein